MKNFKLLIFILTGILFFSSSCKKDDDSNLLVARFTTPIIEFGNVTFRNYSENATEFLWDFDDGNTSTEKEPVHEYKDLGVYQVKLTASNGVSSDTYLLTVAIGQIYPENLTKLDALPFGQRMQMFYFTKDGKGYMGGGIDLSTYSHKNDLWEFDPITKSWTEKSSTFSFNFSQGTSFILNDKAYIGLGNGNFGGGELKMYNYDFQNDDFTFDSYMANNQTDNGYFSSPISFASDNYGFVIGRGQQDYNSKKMWRYNPSDQTWGEYGDYQCAGNSGMLHFMLGEKLFIGLGNESHFSSYLNKSDIWEYNVTTNVWTQKNDFPGEPRRGGISFTYNGIGYFGFGTSSDPNTGSPFSLSDIWKYDDNLDSWEKIANIPIVNNRYLFSFVLDNSLFFGGGTNVNGTGTDDFYELELD